MRKGSHMDANSGGGCSPSGTKTAGTTRSSGPGEGRSGRSDNETILGWCFVFIAPAGFRAKDFRRSRGDGTRWLSKANALAARQERKAVCLAAVNGSGGRVRNHRTPRMTRLAGSAMFLLTMALRRGCPVGRCRRALNLRPGAGWSAWPARAHGIATGPSALRTQPARAAEYRRHRGDIRRRPDDAGPDRAVSRPAPHASDDSRPSIPSRRRKRSAGN